MQILIFGVLITVTIILIQDLCNFLTANFKNYISPHLRESSLITIPSISETFFNDTQTLLLSFGFEKHSQYLFEVDKDVDGCLWHFIHADKGIIAVISQANVPRKYSNDDTNEPTNVKENILSCTFKSYFEDGSLIITTSSLNPKYFDLPKNVFIFTYPLMTPEQILKEHEKNISLLSKGKSPDYDILKRNLTEVSNREGQLIINHNSNKRTLKYNIKKDAYYLTLKGYLKFKYSQMKLYLSQKKSYVVYKNVKKSLIINNFCAGLLFVFLGTLISLSSGESIYLGHQSHSWAKTKGEIMSFRVFETEDNWYYDISYKYVVNNKDYIGDRIYFSAVASISEGEAIVFENKYALPGTVVDVYYDPDNPSLAVLETGANSRLTLILGVLMILFSIPYSIRALKSIKTA